MNRILTRDDIIRAVSRDGSRRSDHDLNPEIPPLTSAPRRLRPAAVLCGMIEREGALHVILTQRPDTMRDHAGQIAFPGGKIDSGDRDATSAALREANEEIGLARDQVEVIGLIDPYETGTGFRIQPIVAMIDPEFVGVPEPMEVAEIFEVPLDFLMNPANLKRHTGVWQGRRRQYYAIPWKGRYIWGATAGMLKSLADRIAAPERFDAAE